MNRKKSIYAWRLFALLAAFVFGRAAFALQPSDVLVFGNQTISLRPQLEAVEQYSDNIFYTTKNTVPDFITIFSPGLKFMVGEDLPNRRHFLVSYFLDELFYMDRSEMDATQHRIRTSTYYDWNRLTLNGSDRIQFLSSALGAGYSLTTNGISVVGVKVDRMIFADSYRADYRLGQRMGVYGEGSFSSVDYQKGIGLYDSSTILGTGGFEWRYSENTHFFGEVYYGQTDLSRNVTNLVVAPGTTFVGGFVGARGEFTEKLKGKIKAGYEVSSFREKAGVFATNLNAGSSPVVEAALSYQFTERLTGNFTYSRRQQVSVQFDRSSYTLDAVSLNFAEIVGSTGRLRVDTTGVYEMYTYEPARAYRSRNDALWRVELGATWFFETWLSTRLQYTHESFHSDLGPVVDYDVNRVTLSLAIGY